MIISDDELVKLLLETRLISQEDLQIALEQAKTTDISLGECIVRRDLLSDEEMGRLLADYLKLPFINLSKVTIPDDVLKLIPEIVAKKHLVISFRKDEDGLHVAFSDPQNIQLIEFIEKKTGIPLKVYFATEQDVKAAISLYSKNLVQSFDNIIADSVTQAKKGENSDPPVIKIIDTIFQHAYQNRASDVHIEAQESVVIIRFRIDGVLHDVIQLPFDLEPLLITRIKVMANLRTDEHQSAQDGKLQFEVEKEKVDVRVSIVPTTKGETIVLRLLSERSRQFSLQNLGLLPNDFQKVQEAFKKPFGMILATGPTGSGKSTTMYAVLKLLNNRDVNIATIEDPVEYDIEGITQIQVNQKTNLTFASGLKSILRQDPNVILVGEIRDPETAAIAINSAMTGHLVLSTLHTNNAATTLPRLLDLGIEPFLVSSTINCIIGQRLVRMICQSCRMSIETNNEELKKYFSEEIIDKHFSDRVEVRLYKGKGCPICHQTGYAGRVGIFEVLVIDDDIRQAIVEKKNASLINAIAIKNGMTTALEDGLAKIKQGVTTIEEIIRVTRE